ncbi:MAG: glycosyltransferase family 39 protein [Gorillibacterium sp.]|nr:glycosyltransferase family 39 protein [Gorillibacterium sp.]
MFLIKLPNVLKASAKHLIVLVLVIALCMRLDFVTNYNFPEVKNDQHFYTVLAIQWIEDGVYGYKSEVPNAEVSPGFPLFLVVVCKVFGYANLERVNDIVRIFNCFFSVGAIWFIYRIGQTLFNRWTGLIAAIMAAIYGPNLFVAGLILTENMFLVLLLAAVYYQVKMIQNNRTRDHVIAGVLAALATLVRPNTIIITIVPYLFLWARHHKLFLKQILFGAGAFALVMLPWWIRNLITLNEFILLSNGSGNPFLGGTDPYNRGTIDWSTVDYSKQTQVGIERVKAGLREDPGLWIRWFTIGKLKYLFLRGIYADYYFRYLHFPAYEVLLRMLHKLLVYVGMVLAVVMPFIKKPYQFLAVHFFLLLGIQLLFIPETRYTYGMMPFLMLIVSAVIVDVISFCCKRLPLKLSSRAR